MRQKDEIIPEEMFLLYSAEWGGTDNNRAGLREDSGDLNRRETRKKA